MAQNTSTKDNLKTSLFLLKGDKLMPFLVTCMLPGHDSNGDPQHLHCFYS